MLMGTMFHHQSKRDVPHVLPKGRIENVRPQTYFFPWICLLKEFPCWQAQLQPRATPILNQSQAMSRQGQTPQTSFSLMISFGACTFVSSSRRKHDFA